MLVEVPEDLMGLTLDEFDTINALLGRAPNHTELGIFAVMWSEHCCYKSSRRWLKMLPTEGPAVIHGPGENAGVVDIGDDQAVVFKIESHNHPSFIEPYQGAATGVGGIMRDVFTMGARPVANLNALRFGSPDHPLTRHLVSGVVAGIGDYGNCMGVPTVGGECSFDHSYNGNILVNAMTVGLADKNRIFTSAAAGVGNPVVYVGARTGRDGIHGATMASAAFDEEGADNRPTVQVGDPFTEKRLLEACLELMATDAIIAIQDMGAAGLTSSSVEMAAKGELGIELDLSRVPTRAPEMTPYELMLSESQERMLMVLRPDKEAQARLIFDKWQLDFATIGRLTDSNHIVLRHEGQVVADIPLTALVERAPAYDRPWIAVPPPVAVDLQAAGQVDYVEAIRHLVGCPAVASKRWLWEQYDSSVMGDTLSRPGGDAAVVRVHGTRKALAMTVDCTPHYCHADPARGGAQAVAEAWRNLTAVGARPLAVTDNLNFGNPERPEVMGQIIGCIRGMADVCRSLDFPVVSGNVSLYNETDDQSILPTPVIGGVGLLDDYDQRVDLALKRTGDTLLVIGDRPGATGWLGQSLFVREMLGRSDGEPPPVDLVAERRHGNLVRSLIRQGLVSACHDISDGGLIVALIEMMLAGGLGARISIPPGMDAGLARNGWLFGEDQARYIVATDRLEEVLQAADKADVAVAGIGTVDGTDLTVDDNRLLSVAELRVLHEIWMPRYMSGKAG